MMADALRIEHLSKTFAGQIALDDVSIDVAAGEVHALVGQNGSGKSTLIKILAGYHQPDPATVRRGSTAQPLTLGDGRRRTPPASGSCTRTSASSASLNAVENMAITAGYHDRSRRPDPVAQEASRTREALSALGLGRPRHQGPGAEPAPGAAHRDRDRPAPGRTGRTAPAC